MNNPDEKPGDDLRARRSPLTSWLVVAAIVGVLLTLARCFLPWGLESFG